ncbi:hypothetical protein J6590_108167, partial [Homalodisca vitripennis]
CNKAKEGILKIINEFPQVFTDKIGQAIDFEIDLEVSDPEPVRLKPYPLSLPRAWFNPNIINII